MILQQAHTGTQSPAMPAVALYRQTPGGRRRRILKATDMPRPLRLAVIASLAATLYCAAATQTAAAQTAAAQDADTDTAVINTSAMTAIKADSASLLPRRAVVLYGDIHSADNKRKTTISGA